MKLKRRNRVSHHEENVQLNFIFKIHVRFFNLDRKSLAFISVKHILIHLL